MGDRGFDDEEQRQEMGQLRDRPGVGQSDACPTVVVLVSIVGSWNEPLAGFISSAGCVCVTIAAMTSIKGSVTWPKSSSLSGSWTSMASFRGHRFTGFF